MIQRLLARLPENNRLERIWVLAKTDFLKRYYGSFLGLLWAFIRPVIHLMIYYSVFTMVLDRGLPQFALFLFLGLVLYMFFSETTNNGLNLIKKNRHLLENIPMNPYDIYFASILSALIAFFFNFTAYFLISLFFDVQVSIQALTFPLLMINFILFIFSVEIILSIVSVYLRDIIHLWDLVRMALLWLSGIFYEVDPDGEGLSAILAFLTPLAGIILNCRNIFIYGESIHWGIFFYDYLYALVLLLIAILVYRKYSGRLLEKI
jgi:ABC-type polysaccharide/polyol phosphate export permease